MAVYADGTKVRVGDIIRPVDNPVDSWTAYVSSVAEVESIDRSHCAMGNVCCKVGGRIGHLYLRASDFVPVIEDNSVEFNETEFLSMIGGE